MKSAFGLLLAVSMLTSTLSWLNEYDMKFTFTCPPGEFLAHIISQYNGFFKDRIWDFSCRSPGSDVSLTKCEWSGYVNEFDKPVFYQCPQSGIITGIESYHENSYEDRRFKFQCCQASDYYVTNCEYTAYVDNFEEHMEYVVSAGKVLRGADSYHLDSHEDRRWKFEVCDLIPH